MEKQGIKYKPVAKNQLTRQVADQIQESILARQLKPGDQLPPQRDLAAQLGASPTVVREALKILEERGLLETRPGIGTFVALLSPQVISQSLSLMVQMSDVTFAQLYELRNLFEAEMAALAASRHNPQDMANLEEALGRIEKLENDREQFVQADYDFHNAIAVATQNPLFSILTIALTGILEENRLWVYDNVPSSHSRSRVEHREIFECIKRCDAKSAREAMRQHVTHSAVESVLWSERNQTDHSETSS
jgi:GntR family transcriptional regulator, transcriptional repressor for pyruvate dehydrogenase complex